MLMKKIREQVLQTGMADTKNYRYIYHECGDHGEILRIRQEYLDTTAALDKANWEKVAHIL